LGSIADNSLYHPEFFFILNVNHLSICLIFCAWLFAVDSKQFLCSKAGYCSGIPNLKSVKLLLKKQEIRHFFYFYFFLLLFFPGIANYYTILLNDLGLNQKQIRFSIAVQGSE